MQLTINQYGKPFWLGVKSDSVISGGNFTEVDKIQSETTTYEFMRDPDSQFVFHCELGSITVLDRMTGFSFVRDTETGFRDTDGKFWLASGMFDIRDYLPLKFSEAVELIKANANNCKGR